MTELAKEKKHIKKTSKNFENETRKNEKMVREMDLLIQRIILKMSESVNSTIFDPIERANIPLDQLFT